MLIEKCNSKSLISPINNEFLQALCKNTLCTNILLDFQDFVVWRRNSNTTCESLVIMCENYRPALPTAKWKVTKSKKNIVRRQSVLFLIFVWLIFIDNLYGYGAFLSWNRQTHTIIRENTVGIFKRRCFEMQL